jgi:2-polyprenyl-3-methyl-5-hydroxy-6-metoxy-1,4-benzoquinol methylase
VQSKTEWFETFFTGAAVEFWIRAMPAAVTMAECGFLEAALALTPGARVLDVPCGHGRHSVELARRGYQVTGVDLSGDCLDRARQFAKEEAVEVDWRQGDMRALALPLDPGDEFDGAFCFGNSLGYLDHGNATAFLAALARAIRPGGRLAVQTGTAAESMMPPGLPRQRWHRMGDILMLSESRYAAAESRLDIDYTFLQGARSETRSTASYVFTAAEYRRMIEQAGFEILALNGGVAGEPFETGPGWLVLTARRL